MIGNIVFNNIIVTYAYAGNSQDGWYAKAPFFDRGFGALEGISTEGELGTRYGVRNSDNVNNPAVDAVKAIITDLTKLGIKRLDEATIFISNREDEELGKGGIPHTHIPQRDIDALRDFASVHGYTLAGI